MNPGCKEIVPVKHVSSINPQIILVIIQLYSFGRLTKLSILYFWRMV
mgnify:CR=1 FL=1|jgi:hypothetical protein